MTLCRTTDSPEEPKHSGLKHRGTEDTELFLCVLRELRASVFPDFLLTDSPEEPEKERVSRPSALVISAVFAFKFFFQNFRVSSSD